METTYELWLESMIPSQSRPKSEFFTNKCWETLALKGDGFDFCLDIGKLTRISFGICAQPGAGCPLENGMQGRLSCSFDMLY